MAEKIKNIVQLKRARIFDFGCGTGLVSSELIPIAAEIVGMDTSVEMVRVFNSKFKERKNMAAATTFPSGKFDLIVSSMVMHHIHDLKSVAEKFSELSKPGTFLCIADLYSEDGTFHEDGNEDVAHFGFDPSRLGGIFSEKGFGIFDISKVFVIKKAKEYPVFLLTMVKER